MKRAAILVLLVAISSSFCAATGPALGQHDLGAPQEQISAEGSRPPQIITVARGTTFTDLFPRPELRGAGEDLDPGVAPEGDYTGVAVFTRDGLRVLVTNRGTNNVTVLDAETMLPLSNFGVGSYPQGIACSDEYAVIACAFGDEVWVVDLDDYSTAAIFPTAEQPWVVRIDAAGERAYIACDIPDICEVIDLTNLSQLPSISNFPISLLTFSFGSENGRNAVSFTNFEITPDGQYLVTGNRDTAVLFFDTQTGTLAHTVSGVIDCPTVGLSGDGAVVVALGSGNPSIAYQIDVASFSTTSSLPVSGYSLRTYQVGVNPDGSKAFMGVSDNSSAIVNFSDASYQILGSTYTPFAIGTSPDHTLALGIQYRYSVVDFASESLVGQRQGITLNSAAISPVGTRTVAFHEMFDETIHFHDYANPAAPQYLGGVVAGAAPEGDAPRRLAITPDLGKIVVSNVLSDNVTIVDPWNQQVNAILAIGDRVQDVAITSDSRWAVVCGFNSNSVVIIDLESEQVVAEVPTGSRAGTVVIAPDDSHAYVGNISSNSISVVELAGAASSEVAERSCGVIGVVWAAYGVSSGLACSPSGDYVLVAASFDDQVKVLDTATNTIVASLNVGDFPIQVAFGREGDYAVTTNYFSDDYTIMHIDGANSSVVGTYSAGTGPLRIGYYHRPTIDWLALAHYDSKNVVQIDPATGDVLDSWSFASYGSLLQAEWGADQELYALTAATGDQPAKLHLPSGETYDLPGQPATFARMTRSGESVVGVVIPGPDYLSMLITVPVGVEWVNFPLHGPGSLAAPSPNPTGGETRLSFALRRDAAASLVVYDLRGRKVAELASGQFLAGDHQLLWNGRDAGGRLVPAGVYCVELRVGQFHQTQRVVVAR